MKCSHYQEHIYLFNELNTDEKQGVLKHIRSCPACQQHYKRVQQDRMIIEAAFTPPPIEDALLTSRIMKAIGNRQPNGIPVIDHLLHFLHNAPMRYALGTLSCFMIIFFFTELFHAPGEHPGMIVNPDAAPPKTVTLNKTLYKELNQESNSNRGSYAGNTLSLYTCIRACQTPAGPDCTDCKIKYAKLKYHEDI